MTFHKRNKRTLVLGAALSSALAFGLSACDKQPDGQMSDNAAADAPKQSANLGEAINDTSITAQVKGRLASDARTQNNTISVETNNGVVTLSGAAPNSEAKLAAEELARMVPEVKGVDNRIGAPGAVQELAAGAEGAAKKAGAAVDDAWITTKVKSALLADTETKGSEISVNTEQGVVQLSGTIDDAAERERAIEIAQATDGVHRVDSSKLTVTR